MIGKTDRAGMRTGIGHDGKLTAILPDGQEIWGDWLCTDNVLETGHLQRTLRRPDGTVIARWIYQDTLPLPEVPELLVRMEKILWDSSQQVREQCEEDLLLTGVCAYTETDKAPFIKRIEPTDILRWSIPQNPEAWVNEYEWSDREIQLMQRERSLTGREAMIMAHIRHLTEGEQIAFMDTGNLPDATWDEMLKFTPPVGAVEPWVIDTFVNAQRDQMGKVTADQVMNRYTNIQRDHAEHIAKLVNERETNGYRPRSHGRGPSAVEEMALITKELDHDMIEEVSKLAQALAFQGAQVDELIAGLKKVSTQVNAIAESCAFMIGQLKPLAVEEKSTDAETQTKKALERVLDDLPQGKIGSKDVDRLDQGIKRARANQAFGRIVGR